MTIAYKTPSQIAEQYLLQVKTLKPEVNTNQTDSDWWIRSRVVGGVFSGIYADQTKVANDAFPQSARREALERHLNLYFDEGFEQAQPSVGFLKVTGNDASFLPTGSVFQYNPNGNIYTSTADLTLDGASGVVHVQSVASGQDQNLLEGAGLILPTPPAGFDSTAVVYGGNMADGRNVETNDEASSRILRQVRTPLAGGKVADYERFALDADPSVTSVNVLRYAFGFGTVGIVITAGTTDIDQAIDNDQPIILVPSDELVATVQAYIETQNPITDCATVLKPATTPQDVTVFVHYLSGHNDTINSGQTLTQAELVEREVRRAIYKTPPGGRLIGSSGYVVASEIEATIDTNLASNVYYTGHLAQIVVDRQVQDLSASGANRGLLGNEIAIPATITVVEF